MDITRESGNWYQAGAAMTEENTEYKTDDRCHVDSLLNISEESFAKETLHGMHVQSAWEQVKGWNECPPLACLLQLQNKYKPAKIGEHEFHCLLCIDATLSQKPEEDHCANSESSETNCSLAEDHKVKNSLFPTIHLETPPISPSENSGSDTGWNSFKYETKATIQAESCKVTERAKLHRLQDTLPTLVYIKLAMQCPMMKKKGIIKKFSVLPPVKGSGYPRGTRLRRVAASTLCLSDSLTAETRSCGLPLTGEGHVEGEDGSPGANSGTEIFEDSHRSLTAKCYQSPPSKQLLSTFSIRLPKRCGSSLKSFEDTLSRAADLVGRKIKNDSPIRAAVNNNQGHNQKQTQNELPALLGTRVPMQAMSHRIAYTSNA
ncbi:hypothetical protein SKAU_G00352510 [Synaphobranchus kaupii]|uniref:Uncharacterized protein n=1 Tax=Synaphobranchus kaupii TaxID=118154 RepID=A0A9Q1IG52_SYNKA|nr:hypothetical protein SKAU_G00352510 [Synaphobranchus kaupii]